MATKGLPLLIIGGAALFMFSGKKKSKKRAPEPAPPVDDGIIFTDDEDDFDYDSIPDLEPSSGGGGGRPGGSPPRGNSYDADYWGGSDPDRLISIRQHFSDLGYQNEVGPWPMNILGPKGSVEFENMDGTTGALGGGDDKENQIVSKFQRDYNTVSKLSSADNIYQKKLGGLSADGLVGPHTLNALRAAVEGLPGGKTWTDLLSSASIKGIK